MDFRKSFPRQAPVPSEWHARSGPPTESNAWLPAAFGNRHGDLFFLGGLHHQKTMNKWEKMVKHGDLT